MKIKIMAHPTRTSTMVRLSSFLLSFILLCSVFMVSTPVFAESPSSTITGGWNTTFYITKDGTLWGYGKNAEGLLLSTDSTVSSPKSLLKDVKSASANRYNVLAIKKDNTLWYWGGIGNESSDTPKQIMEDVVMVSTDDYYRTPIFVLKGDGTMLLNMGKGFEPISHDLKVKFIMTTGSRHYFINELDELWGWTDDKDGSSAMGLGALRPVPVPERIMEDVIYVAGDNSNTMIIRKDASLWTCGNGISGQVYNGSGQTPAPVLSPIKIMDNVQQVALRDLEFYAVKKDKTLWVWGENIHKTVGPSYLEVPVKLADQVANVWAATGHTLVAKTDRTLWTAGSNQGVLNATSGYNPLKLTAQDLVDAPASWALTEVREAEYRKLVPPAMQSDYTKVVTRSEFCTLAIICVEQTMAMPIEDYLASLSKTMPTSSNFTDISSISTASRNDIMAAFELGIVNGMTATTFEPNKPITREQAAKMLTAAAAALKQATSAQTPAFADVDQIANWAKPFIGYVYNVNIMGGVGENRFNPLGGYERQQAYMTMLRLYKHITNQ